MPCEQPTSSECLAIGCQPYRDSCPGEVGLAVQTPFPQGTDFSNNFLEVWPPKSSRWHQSQPLPLHPWQQGCHRPCPRKTGGRQSLRMKSTVHEAICPLVPTILHSETSEKQGLHAYSSWPFNLKLSHRSCVLNPDPMRGRCLPSPTRLYPQNISQRTPPHTPQNVHMALLLTAKP